MMGWFTSQLRRPLLPEFTPQALAVTAYGFAKLEVRHGAQGYRQGIQGLSRWPRRPKTMAFEHQNQGLTRIDGWIYDRFL